MAGAYTEIFAIHVPATAKVGDSVVVGVAVQNTSPSNLYITITGNIDGVPVYFGNDVKYIGAGAIATFYETFIMPNHDVTILTWSFAKPSLDLPWQSEDDSMQASVALDGTPTGEVAGSIVSVEVKKGSLTQPIPAAGIEVGDRPTILVTVKNTGTASFRPYLYYRYIPPDMNPLGSTEAKLTEMDPGDPHTFEEPAFGIDVNQPGVWYIYCELRDDYNGNVLDTFSTTVLFVAGGVIPYTDLADVNITIAAGTYEIGDTVPFSVSYQYRGSAQMGLLAIRLRTLGYDDYTFPEILTELATSVDWAPGTITGYITIPSELEPGATYNVRATLRTEDGVVEKTDIKLNVITVYEGPLIAGEITSIKVRELYIDKDIPAPDVVKNDFFTVLVYVKSTSINEGRFYLDCVITKPSGATIGRENEQQNLSPGQEHIYEIQPEGFSLAYRVDETGDWYVECKLKSVDGIELANTGQLHLFTAGSSGATSDLQLYDIEATLPSEHPVLGPLSTLEVGVTFKYTSTEDVELQLWASLALGIGRDIETFETIQLTESPTENTWSGSIILQVPESGVPDGEYALRVEVDGEETTIQGAVTLTGMPGTGFGDIGEIGTLVGMLVLMMVMQMMMGLMGEVGGLVSTVGVKGGELVGARARLLIEKAEWRVRQLKDKLEGLVRQAEGLVGAARESVERQIGRVEGQIERAEEQVRRAEEQIRQ